MARELALARELLKLIVDEAFAAQMCDKAKDVDPELGAAIYKMLPGIKKFLSTSRVPGLVVVKSEDLDALKMWYEEIPVSGEPNWQSLEEIVKALTRAKEGE